MRISDWSSDVCSSDLVLGVAYRSQVQQHAEAEPRARHRRLAVVDVPHRVLQAPLVLAVVGLQVREVVVDRARKDRKSVVSGKSVSVRVDLGGRRILKKKKI